MPAASIVIPTRNRAQLLARAVRSALSQTVADIEVIVVDDGGADHTRSLVKALIDPRVRYFRRDEPGGASAARNVGILAAEAPLVAFLDDDDELLPQFVDETLSAFSATPGADFSWCGVRYVDASGSVIRKRHWAPSNLSEAYHEYLRDLSVALWGITAKRRVLLDVGMFNESLRHGEDKELVARLFKHSSPAVVRDHLLVYHHHDGERLSHGPKSDAALDTLMKVHADAVAVDRRIAASFHVRYAGSRYRAGNPRRARRSILSAIQCDPSYLRAFSMFFRGEATLVRHRTG